MPNAVDMLFAYKKQILIGEFSDKKRKQINEKMSALHIMVDSEHPVGTVTSSVGTDETVEVELGGK